MCGIVFSRLTRKRGAQKVSSLVTLVKGTGSKIRQAVFFTLNASFHDTHERTFVGTFICKSSSRKLPVVQIRVFSIACQQFFVSAALGNVSFVYDDDCGGVADSRETVRNDERGAPLE